MNKQTEELKMALNKAFQLGKRYWSWADSECSSHWKKADAAKAEFDQLVQDTINAALAEQPAQQEPVAQVVMAAKPPNASLAWLPFKIVHASLEWLDSVPVGTKLYTSPPAQRKPLTDEMVVAAARMLSDRQAAACNVDCGDMWKLHGNDFIDDARAALEAANGIKE